MLTSTTIRSQDETTRFSVLLKIDELGPLDKCLKAFRYQSMSAESFEVICIDRHQKKADLDCMAKYKSRLNIRHCPAQGMNYLQSLHQAINQASHEYILLWNSQLIPHIDNLLNFAKTLSNPLTQDVILGATLMDPGFSEMFISQALGLIGIPFYKPIYHCHDTLDFFAFNLFNVVIRKQIWQDHLSPFISDYQTLRVNSFAAGLALWQAGFRPVFEPEARGFFLKQMSMHDVLVGMPALAQDLKYFYQRHRVVCDIWELGDIFNPFVQKTMQNVLHEQIQIEEMVQKIQRVEHSFIYFLSSEGPEQFNYQVFINMFQTVFRDTLYRHILALTKDEKPSNQQKLLIYPHYAQHLKQPSTQDVFYEKMTRTQALINQENGASPLLKHLEDIGFIYRFIDDYNPTNKLVSNQPAQSLEQELLVFLSQKYAHRGGVKCWNLLPHTPFAYHKQPISMQAANENFSEDDLKENIETIFGEAQPIDILILFQQSFENLFQTFIQANQHMQPHSILMINTADQALMQGFISLIQHNYPYRTLYQFERLIIFYKVCQSSPRPHRLQPSKESIYYQNYLHFYNLEKDKLLEINKLKDD